MKKILKNKKGFTLVEIIVVLVILAILAGAAIPTMLGFIDDAKNKTVIAEGRAVLVAAQVKATEAYAVDGEVLVGDIDATLVKTLAGVDGVASDFVVAGGKVTGFKYTVNAKVVTYDQAKGDKFTVK